MSTPLPFTHDRSLRARVGPIAVSLAMAGVMAAPAYALGPIGFPAAAAGPVFGAASRFDNLAVYPITMALQSDIGPVISLEEALQKKLAEVREVGSEAAPPPRHPHPNAPQIQQQMDGGGAAVNTLVIENKGDQPVFVLAGTVVKGGNQDRQIGQDFVVDAGTVVPVDAFCVEHGRWTGSRQGRQTAGRFEAADTLATSKVRRAGQHKKDQGAVWSEVAVANAANGKTAESGTLLATLDAGDVGKRADALAARIHSALAAAPADQLVGFAYAIDGHIQGVRWFASQRLFAMYKDKLVRTAAIDALTAEAEAKGKDAFAGAWPSGDDVMKFVADVDAQAVKELRDTSGANENEYKESDRAFGAKTLLKAKADAKAKPVSYDYLTK